MNKLLRAVDYTALAIAFIGVVIFVGGTLLFELLHAMYKLIHDLYHLPDDPTIRWLLPIVGIAAVWVVVRWKEFKKR